MKKHLRILIVMAFCLFFLMPYAFISQASDVIQDGLEVHLETDKEHYSEGEKIGIVFTIKNTNSFDVEDVSVQTFLPAGYVCANEEDVSRSIGLIRSGEVVTVEGMYLVCESNNEGENNESIDSQLENEESRGTADEVANSAETASNTNQSVSEKNNYSNPKTGDKIVVTIICTALFTACMVSVIICKKKGLFIAIILVSVGTMATATYTNANENRAISSISISTMVTVEGNNVEINGIVTYKNFKESETYETADEVSEQDTTDTDGDGVVDWIEIQCNSNINEKDTDNDGLDDYVEIYKLYTDPTKPDSNGNGILDKDEDFDNDGIKNIDELNAGTNPLSADTDGDGINDNDEANYGTNPMNEDTDEDGATDGWEINNGFNPLSFNSSFEVEKEVAGDNIKTFATMNLKGSMVEDLNISISENEELVNENMPGYIGEAYDFSLNNQDFDSADIGFEFDENLLDNDEFEPKIYYFNEETQLLEELETKVEGNVATATVSHFSTYVLLDKTKYDQVWLTDIKSPTMPQNGEKAKMDVAIVLDYSNSMEHNDPDETYKKVCKDFIGKLNDDTDRVTVIKFIKTATVLAELSSDKETLYSVIDSMQYDSGYGENSGTDGSNGLKVALQQLDSSEADYKYIIFITDGEDNRYSYDYSDLIKEANEDKVSIYTIGMGTASETLLRRIAKNTNGKYYYATATEDSEEYLDLNSAFENIKEDTIDVTTDCNNDGISDYYTKLLCEGKLTSGTGVKLFSGIKYEDVQANDDFDGDGIKNGAEVIVTQNNNKVYVKVISSPTSTDSDKDGVLDNKDSAPLKKGLANGIYGKLTLISNYNRERSKWSSGHVFFVYTSYINDTIDLSKLAYGWSKSNVNKTWSIDNIKEDDPLQKKYSVKAGESITIGNGAFSKGMFLIGDGSGSMGVPGIESGTWLDHNGVNYNMELYKYLSDSQYYAYIGNTYLDEDITKKQLNMLINYCGSPKVCYWNLTHNCAEVGMNAWNQISKRKVSAYNEKFLGGNVATPKGLKIFIRQNYEKEHGEDFYLDEAFIN